MSKKKMLFLCFSAVMMLSFTLAGVSAAAESVETILGGRTALHWDRDFLAWVVHYPDKMVDPWVSSRTGGNGDPTGKMARDFRKSLRMDDSTPVLLSVHCFAGRPVDLKPLPEKLYIVKSSGERVAPHAYDKVFDSPLEGLVQGFVYFPRVEGPFRVFLERGSGPGLAFEFPEDRENRIRKETAQKTMIETGSASGGGAVNGSPQVPAYGDEIKKIRDEQKRESERLNARIKELAAERDRLRSELDSTLAAMARERNIEVDLAPRPLVSAQPHVLLPEPVQEEAPEPGTGMSREEAALCFLQAWKDGDLEGMYRLLSPETRRSIPDVNALAEYMGKKMLPDRMPGDAKLVDKGEGGVKIHFAVKVLVMRTLRSVNLELVEWNGGFSVGLGD